MQQRAFFYDLASEGWKECMNPNYVMSDMALVPVHQVVLRKKSISAPAQQEVWCAKHHAYELVDKLGERELTTREGCQMQGLLQGGFHWKGGECSKISVSPIRWRVLYYEDIGAVALIQDIPEIWWGRNTDTRTNEVVWVPDLRGFRTEEVTFRFREERIYREKHCQDIPDCVADAALAYMADAAVGEFGQRPSLPANLRKPPFLDDGRLKLEAFLHNPFDMNLYLLKQVFGYGNQAAAIFSRQSKNGFAMLCNSLHLEPSNFLEESYSANPYAPIMIAILQSLGIKQSQLIQPFLAEPQFFGNSFPIVCKEDLGIYDAHHIKQETFSKEFFEDDEKVRAMLLSRRGYRGNANKVSLSFYCQWYLYQTDEEALAHHLLMLQKSWKPHYWHFLESFYHYYPDIPAEIRQRILAEGCSLEMENTMIDAINKRKLNWPDFFYTEEEKQYACRIGDFEFKLIYTSEEFHSLMRIILSCHPSMFPSLKDDGVLRVAVLKEGRNVACLLVHKIVKTIIHHSGGVYDSAFYEADIRTAVLRWLKWTGLYKKYGPYYESDYEILDQEVEAEPLQESGRNTLYELLHLPEKDIRPGYYLQLKDALAANKILYRSVPEDKVFFSEYEYLMAAYPYAERIYKAAIAGNAEAQKALAMCYGSSAYYSLIKYNKERYEYWNNKYLES